MSQWIVTTSPSDFTVKEETPTQKGNKKMLWAETQIDRSLDKTGLPALVSKLVGEHDLLNLLRDNPDRLKRLDQTDRAKLIACYPSLEAIIPFEELPETFQAVLAKRQPSRFFERLDPKKLSIQTYRYLMFANAGSITGGYVPTMEEKAMIRKLFKGMSEEVAQAIRYREWIYLIRAIPSAAKRIRIAKVRNQTELRRLIVAHPIIMKYATLRDMQESPIAGHTWARLIADIPAKSRVHFPVGTKEWVEKQIFVRQLKAGKTKQFKEWTDKLP